MKTILLPLDLGSNTMSLVNQAMPIAAQNNATLVLFHVIRKQPYDNGTFDPSTAVHRQVRQEAEIILDQISRQTFGRGVRSKVLIEEGNPTEAILHCAKNKQVDLIVMSRTCGKATCTSEEVLRSAPCPVLSCSN